jgi:uncharacterized peroxidase-related enzyme
VAAHGEALRRETRDDALVAAIQADHRTAPVDAVTRRLLAYAERVTRDAASVSRADVEELRGHGVTDEQILETLHVAGLYNYLDRVADALGVEIDPEFRPPA